MKCVVIVNEELPAGLAANTAAALGISLASVVEGLTGEDLEDGEGRIHAGITSIPIPILCLPPEELKKHYNALLESSHEDLRIIGFSRIAQGSRNYEEYAAKLKATSRNNIDYAGFCLYGPKKKINKLTGNIKMFR
jgi:hypothetical protein